MDTITDLAKLSDDERFNVWHLALITAILQLACEQRNKSKICVSRSKLMKRSLIRTIPTFHKYFRELQNYGYLTYEPSYHPNGKSTVIINF